MAEPVPSIPIPIPPVDPVPTSSIAPPAPQPELGKEMTTIIENGQTVVLPVPRTNSDHPAQSDHAEGWAGLGNMGMTSTPPGGPGVPTPTSLVPVPAPSVAAPAAPADPGLPLPPPAAGTSSAVVPVPAPVPSLPPGQLVPGAPAAPTSSTADAVLPPVLLNNDKPSVPVTTSSSSSSTKPNISPLPQAPVFSDPVAIKPSSSRLPPPRPSSSTRDVSLVPGGPSATSSSASSTSKGASASASATSSAVADFPFVPVAPSSSSRTRTVWDAMGGSSSGAIENVAAKPTTSSSARAPGPVPIPSLSTSATMLDGVKAGQIASQSAGTGPVTVLVDAPPDVSQGDAASSSQQPIPSLPPAGSPEEAKVLAVVSSTITLSGSAAVAAIKAGATQLGSGGGTTSNSTTGDDGGLSGFAIAGIVGGGVLGLIIVVVVWYRWRKKSKDKDDEPSQDMTEAQRPDTAFSFSDDPVTASTGRIRRGTMQAAQQGQGPFDDRYQSQYGGGSGYQPHQDGEHDIHAQREYTQGTDQDGYPFPAQGTHDSAPHPHVRLEGQDDLNELYGSAIEEEQARRELTNPFAPPVPPLPASVRQSGLSRPGTSYTDIYGAYESRPATQVLEDRYSHRAHPPRREDDDDDDGDLPAQTPATSSLLPWLKKDPAPPPPVPALPAPARRRGREEREERNLDVPQDVGIGEGEGEGGGREYTRYESNVAGLGARGGPPPRPARPVMAQTPAWAGANEFNVMIPGFR